MCISGTKKNNPPSEPTYTPPQAPYTIATQYAVPKTPQNADTSGVENNNQQYVSYSPPQMAKQFNFKLYPNNTYLSQSGVNTLE